MTDVAIFGGGVAGLTAAQELGERGYIVRLYEQREVVGGKARSFGKEGTGQAGLRDLPGEHGFRFYPGFYKHVPHTMSRVPLQTGVGNVKDNRVAVPSFSLAFKDAPPITMNTSARVPTTPVEWGVAVANLFAGQQVGLALDDPFFFAERMLCALASCQERREQEYEHMNWANYIRINERGPAYKRVFSDGLARPLVAMDPGRINAQTALIVMIQILQDMIGGGGADHVLNGPTTDAWINHWYAYLSGMANVTFTPNATARAIAMRNGRIDNVTVQTSAGTQDVTADHYIFAVPVEVMQGLLTSAMLAAAPELAGIQSLETSWMTGLVYYFSTPVAMGIAGHGIYADSPWALTSISQLPFWTDPAGTDIGAGNVGSVFSVIISNWDSPGIGTSQTARQCTHDELVTEVTLQLNAHLQNVSSGSLLGSTTLLDTFLDPAISFDSAGVVAGNAEPLLVNTVGSYGLRPPAVTSIENLFLSGDYVRTGTNLATMEGACEAGRLAAKGVLQQDGWNGGPLPEVFPHKEHPMFDPFKQLDGFLFPTGEGPPCPASFKELMDASAKLK